MLLPLILLWGVIVGLGTGLTALVLAATLSTRWFNARRGSDSSPSGRMRSTRPTHHPHKPPST